MTRHVKWEDVPNSCQKQATVTSLRFSKRKAHAQWNHGFQEGRRNQHAHTILINNVQRSSVTYRFIFPKPKLSLKNLNYLLLVAISSDVSDMNLVEARQKSILRKHVTWRKTAVLPSEISTRQLVHRESMAVRKLYFLDVIFRIESVSNINWRQIFLAILWTFQQRSLSIEMSKQYDTSRPGEALHVLLQLLGSHTRSEMNPLVAVGMVQKRCTKIRS